MTVNVYTGQYEASHGRKPKGRGYWMFAISSYMQGTEETGFYGTYTEAKKQAVKLARDLGWDSVSVLP